MTIASFYQYNKKGRLLKTTYPDGTVTSQDWNAAGQRITSTSGNGLHTHFEYDEIGRLTKTTDYDGGVETLTYDAENHRSSRTDAIGRVTKYAYDAVGRVTTTTAPDNTTTKNTYDKAGNLISTTNEVGKITSYAYDAANRRISTTDPLGNTNYSIFDTLGRQIETIAADNTATEYVYNDAGDLLETRYPNSTKTSAEYDILGRQISKTDELGRKTSFTYDALGRLTSVTDAANQTTRYTYDELGNQLTQTDANGRVTQFAYDTRGRVKERMLPDGNREAYTYDDAGNMATKSDYAGNIVSYGYNGKGQQFKRSYSDNSEVSFNFDLAGQRIAARDARGKTSYTYDLRGHVTRILYPDGRELDYTYDPRGIRSTITAKIGTKVLTTTTGYDNAGRLSTVTDPLSRAYGAQYDANSNRISLNYPNSETTSYAYDTRGHLTSLITKQPGSNGTIAQSYGYTLDAAGKRTRIQEADGTIRQYGYDSVDRLTSEAVTGPTNYSNSFEYDAVGNRLTQTNAGSHPGTVNYTYDRRDELTKENSTAYSYDKNGNLTAKIGEAGYTWDYERRLTQVSLLDGTTIDHSYDADGNRVQTKVTPPGGTASTTNYLVDTTGNLSQVVAESDGTGALTAVYVRAYDEMLAVLRPTSATTWATRYVHSDGLGSVRVLTDETGNVTDTRGYEAFGVRNATTGNDALAFGFAGEPFDSVAKLAYHRARWMDPRVGRFLGMDPLTGRLGNPLSLHKYLYVADEPIDATDASGLEFSLAGVSASVSMGQILSTMATVGRVAVAAALTCEASLAASFFETASPTDRSSLCKKRCFNHYTSEQGRAGISQGRFIKRSNDGYVYLTTDFYFTGTLAKSKLALSYVPVGFFRIPEVSIIDVPRLGLAQPANGELGGGEEWVSPEQVPIARAVWMNIF